MLKSLGDTIYKSRLDLDLTQDEFGARYSVSGPAIFKFEKGYVRPSLALWLRIADETPLTERRAVIMWLRSKLPKQYQNYLELGKGADPSRLIEKNLKAKASIDYALIENRDLVRETIKRDRTLPKHLAALLKDDDIWELFKPTGHEINLLRDMFGPLGKGSKAAYREALFLVRAFIHSF